MKCLHCKKNIKPSDKWVEVVTHYGTAKEVSENFHFECWKEYFDLCMRKKVLSKANKMFGNMQDFIKKETQLK